MAEPRRRVVVYLGGAAARWLRAQPRKSRSLLVEALLEAHAQAHLETPLASQGEAAASVVRRERARYGKKSVG